MEFGMIAKEDIEIGEYITQQIPPISLALNHSLFFSHCSSCFVPLSPPHQNTLFCSSQCSNYHSTLAADRLLPHADHRAALRLLRSSRAASPGRIAAGLLTNSRKLTDEEDDVADAINDGARAIAAAIGDCSESAVAEATAAMCAVTTNGVEVRDETGVVSLGVAVYGPRFSWINHSCSPNACYRISLSSELETTSSLDETTHSKIVPCFSAAQSSESGVSNDIDNVLAKEMEWSESCDYGPRIRVRSIKRIKKGEEITVAYTDLLQTKALRQSELWSKYRFICGCSRCSAVPSTYVDRALEEIYVTHVGSLSSSRDFDKERANELLTEYINDAIADYLSLSDAQSCSEKLERILTFGLPNDQSECNEEKAPSTYRLHPLHHLSLNTYTTLASTYKTRANNLLALDSEKNRNRSDAFHTSRISLAYSLLLAGATNHLFRHEPSLIVSAANFWSSAGESLVAFATSVEWSEYLPVSNISSMTTKNQICPKCSLQNIFDTNPSYAEFENVRSKFFDCVTFYAQNVWRPLVRNYDPLRTFYDPVDFSWLETSKSSGHSTVKFADLDGENGKKNSRCEVPRQAYLDRVLVFQLGVHCLLYGGYLGSISLGEHSYLTRHVNYIFDGLCN